MLYQHDEYTQDFNPTHMIANIGGLFVAILAEKSLLKISL